MNKLILAVVTLVVSLTTVASAQTNFTIEKLTAGCPHRVEYAPDVHAGDTLWTCSVVPVTFSDGDYYIQQTVYLHPDGTFDGTFRISQRDFAHPSARVEYVPFAGTWVGTVQTQNVGSCCTEKYFRPDSLNGAFGDGGSVGNGTVTEFFAFVQRGGYRYTKIFEWSLIGGTGKIQ